MSYTHDNNCYNTSTNLSNDISLANFVDMHFNITTLNIPDSGNISECQDKALLSNKDYFLISDLSKAVLTNALTYNCYIPKANSKCNFEKINEVFEPFNTVINDLFGTPKTPLTDNISNVINWPTSLDDTIKCYKYTSDNITNIFPKNKVFALYKTNLVDNDNFNTNNDDNPINTFEYYHDKNIYKFNKSTFNAKLDILTTTFNDYICKTPNDTALDIALKDIKDYYDAMFIVLDAITSDISNIELVTRSDTYKLQNIQNKIDIEQKKLRDILGFDGASNGKLDDTTYLKNLKLSETIILCIIIIFSIFIYNKGK